MRNHWKFSLPLTAVAVVAFGLGLHSTLNRNDHYQRLPAAADHDAGDQGVFPRWAYDPGPDPTNAMGRELIDLNAGIPCFPCISGAVTGDQKFRPDFGPIPWRMLQKPNSVKILFIGQDGTHIAEAAGRPATAGFGGRAQDLARYFGVSSSAAFMNTYAFTIRGQYGTFDSPIIHNDPAGGPQVLFSAFVDNHLWLMSQDQDSPIVQWRNQLIDWILRNNRDSLKMIVLFGGAARDAAGAFVESKGGKVGTRMAAAELARIQVPETQLVGTGGNNESPVPLTKTGTDLYEQILGSKPNYTDPTGAGLKAAQDAFAKAVKADPARVLGQMVFSRGGLGGSGVLHPAQVGGYDIAEQMEINGRKTLSLQGLKLSDGQVIGHELLVVQLPHPTALSMMTPDQASQKVGEALRAFKPYVDAGWTIEADGGFTNTFAAGQPYQYGRAPMGPEYYDFGAPLSRMVDVSSASRLTHNVIIFGTRDRARFDQARVQAMTAAQPARLPAQDEMWIARPRSAKTRYVFDAGPGPKYARIMKENLPQELIRSHVVNGDFGHYRGTFSNPRVLILADPDGYDDLITARALTGTRGQYLHGLMEDLGVGDRYLVIKTAPFSLVETNPAEWKDIVFKTQAYREALIGAVLRDGKPDLILADGAYAAQEIDRILGKNAPCPLVTLGRQAGKQDAGILEAAPGIRKIPAFAQAEISGKMADIPRSHLSYYARVWEGTSGDRVITSSDPQYAGQAFAEVAPQWAFSQKFEMGATDTAGVENLVKKETSARVRHGGESIQVFAGHLQ